MPDENNEGLSTRRRFIAEIAGGLAGAALGGCGGQTGAEAAGGAGTGGAGTGGLEGETGGSATGGSGIGGNGTGGLPAGDSGTCVLYPQQMEGPFFLDLGLLRSDITEGKPGAALELELSVVSLDGCAPMPNVVVDIWQCDAVGVYGGFPGQLGGQNTTGLTFLRGTQITDAAGRVVFHTIYPGWYPGRTTHIHFKVRPTANTEVTSQMYFPEDVTAVVYYAPPYAAHGPKDTTNVADAIAQTGGFPPVVEIADTAQGMRGRLTVAIA